MDYLILLSSIFAGALTVIQFRLEERSYVKLFNAFTGAYLLSITFLHLLPELYGRIGAPALVLWGESDAHFPVVHAKRLHAAIPGSELTVLEGAGHWMAWDRAEAVAARVSAFLRGTA